MQAYQESFIEFAIDNKVLRFGDFTLKSGRKSPYFFNIGNIRDGQGLLKAGDFYARALVKADISDKFDIIFGPAYKGITLATAISMALYKNFDINKPIAYNRKEAKDHGEGGMIVGEPLAGKKILVVDDVVTSGKTLLEAEKIIKTANGSFYGALVAIDRQEKAQDSEELALTTIAKNLKIDIHSIIKLEHVINYLEELPSNHKLKEQLKVMKTYHSS